MTDEQILELWINIQKSLATLREGQEELLAAIRASRPQTWPDDKQETTPDENINVEEDWGNSSWNESGRTETDKGE